ncbi:MAG: hypothetical protein U9Q90_03350 [Campylobacterota bacterium]|nr:hypothetical protein [Campylobacterota bacterium]
MKTVFAEDYPKFKQKIDGFVNHTKFYDRFEEYTKIFDQMASVSPDDMREFIEKSPLFIKARNESMKLMEEIVSINLGLKEIFELDQASLGKRCNYDLEKIDQKIAGDIKRLAQLLHDYEIASEKGREAIEEAQDTFFEQAR